jgi:hypothetical protein
MPGAQKLRSEAPFKVRGNDEVEAQRRRWSFLRNHQPGNKKPAGNFKRVSSFPSGNPPERLPKKGRSLRPLWGKISLFLGKYQQKKSSQFLFGATFFFQPVGDG